MDSGWKKAKESWSSHTDLSKEISTWALDPLINNEDLIEEIEKALTNKTQKNRSQIHEDNLKVLKRKIKIEVSKKENSLDNLSLNSPNTYKLQVSVPSNLNYLMKAWAAAEGRDLSSVALQCIESGLREMKSNGSIPIAALKRYDNACEKRIALAEVNEVWDRHERELINKINKIS